MATPAAARPRKIIHVDMDAFFASVEQRDHPELRGKPLVVGGDPRRRGVVAAASYEARKFGVRSAMSAAQAQRLCPHLVFVPPRMERYREVSRTIQAIFHAVTPLVEPLSLDEAYLDVTDNALGEPLAGRVALWLKREIRDAVELTASAGVGPSKLIAKIASDLDKPDGLVVIPPERVLAFLKDLPVERLWGVGPATATRLRTLGLRTAGDLREVPPQVLEQELGKYGRFLYGLAHGDDPRPVQPHREPKSRGSETTFDRDVTSIERLVEVIGAQAREVAENLRALRRPGRTVTLKVRYADFTTITRSRTLPAVTDDADLVAATAADLLRTATEAAQRPVRLIGVSVSGFADPDAPEQLELDLERALRLR